MNDDMLEMTCYILALIHEHAKRNVEGANDDNTSKRIADEYARQIASVRDLSTDEIANEYGTWRTIIDDTFIN